jgi:hypothetical protein
MMWKLPSRAKMLPEAKILRERSASASKREKG